MFKNRFNALDCLVVGLCSALLTNHTNIWEVIAIGAVGLMISVVGEGMTRNDN